MRIIYIAQNDCQKTPSPLTGKIKLPIDIFLLRCKIQLKVKESQNQKRGEKSEIIRSNRAIYKRVNGRFR